MTGMPGTSYRGELPPADEGLLSLAADLRQDVTRLAVDIGDLFATAEGRTLRVAGDLCRSRWAAVLGCRRGIGFLNLGKEHVLVGSD
jgi:hypothetical protein